MMNTQSSTSVLEGTGGTAWPVEESPDVAIAAATRLPRVRSIKVTAAGIAKFLLHFIEMAIAMFVGMAIFWPFKTALVDQGYTILLDRSSIEYQVWMNVFMVVPMALWMRARGHSWRHAAEMGAAMIAPVAVILFVCSLGIEGMLPWFTTSLAGIAMFLGMLGYMLYRRDMYTGSYSFDWIRRLRTWP